MDKKQKRQTRGQSVSVIVPTSCQKCGSTERTRYGNTVTLPCGVTWKDLPGIPAGTPYVELRKSHTSCLKCGQSRVDQQFVFEPKVFALRTNEEGIAG